ncbi:ribonucleoside triphosphate reductase [bacterium]|nr:ribonucleoside triphosphate reductase [bacterium]
MQETKIEKIRKRNGRVVKFKTEKIAQAIYKATQAIGSPDFNLAQKISKKVVERLYKKFDGNIPTVEQVQDIVEEALIEERLISLAKAYILYREQHREMRELSKKMNIDLVDKYVQKKDWQVKENSNMTYSLQGLNNYVSSEVTKEYWLNKIYPEEIRNAYYNGDFHIHDLGLLSVYTYYGKELVVAKIDGLLKLVSFEKLYDLIKRKERLLNKKESAFAKHPKDVYVLDRNGWTKVKRLVRKKKNRTMHFVKNRGGRSVIVTDNHPMIVERGERMAADVRVGNDKLFTVDLNKLLQKEKIFFIKEVDLLKEIKQNEWKDSQVYFNGLPIEKVSSSREEGFLHTVKFIIPRKIKLSEKFGYFVGFTLAEGYLSYDKKSPRTISLSQKDKKSLLRANQGLLENGMSGCLIKRGDKYELEIKNPFLKFLFQKVFKINTGSKNKTLPIDILLYNKEFAKGVISGLIDGDGSLETSKTTISLRISSRTMLEQCYVLLSSLGFTPRDRDIEGQGSIRFYKGRKIVQNYPLYGLSFRKIKGLNLPSDVYNKAGFSKKSWQDETRNSWHKVLNNRVVKIPDKFIYDITTESKTLVVNGMWNHNCVGWDLSDLLVQGFKGAAGKIESSPAKHFRSALGQIVNFFYTLQGEAAGAEAFSDFDVLLAPFIRYDKLSYPEVKQALQEFLFNMNVPTRVGFQSPFTNLTMALTPPSYYKDQAVIIGGKPQNAVYGDFQKEMDILNKAFAEVMLEGDASGRVFSFPIPTYNITKDFDWDNPVLKPLWAMTAKYGIPYFSNFINSDMKPDDVRSMCCRLRLDTRELRKRGGGLFGSSPLTGSVGVVTINMPRLGYLSKSEKEFKERLTRLMDLAKESLEIKRKVLERFTENDLYPYSKFYLRSIKQRFGHYWQNHFATIGLIGMNEACLNFLGKNIGTKEGLEFARRILSFMRERLLQYQKETGNVYNLEATPAEGTSYRLARKDKEKYPDIICANEKEYQEKKTPPYYTNSSQLPVGFTDDPFEALDLQDPLQILYTGGTVVHLFAGEQIKDPNSIKTLVKKVCEDYRLPYFTITPTFSICPDIGYVPGEHFKSPKSGCPCEVYSRVVGYLRPVKQWNEGKQEEFKQRKEFKLE